MFRNGMTRPLRAPSIKIIILNISLSE